MIILWALARLAGWLRRGALSWTPVLGKRTAKSITVPLVLAEDVERGFGATIASLTLTYSPAPADGGSGRLVAVPPRPETDEEEFDQSLAAVEAWAVGQDRLPRTGTITWQIVRQREAVRNVEGGSTGAAFAIALAYMFRLTRASRRRRDDRAIASAVVEASGQLTGVGALDRKMPVVVEQGYRLIVASSDLTQARSVGGAGASGVRGAFSVPEAVQLSQLSRSRGFAATMVAVVLLAFLGGWVARREQRDGAAQRARLQASLEQRSTDNLGVRPDQAIELAVQAENLAPGSVSARQHLLAATYADLRVRRIVNGGDEPVHALSFAGDVLVVAQGGTLATFDAESGRLVARTSRVAGTVTALAVGAQGRTLLAGTDAGAVLVWDIDRLSAAPQTLQQSGGPVVAVAVSPKSTTAAWGSHTDGIMTRRIGATSDAAVRVADAPSLSALAFTDEKTLTAGSFPYTSRDVPVLRAYDLTRRILPRVLLTSGIRALASRGVTSLAVALAGDLLVAGSADSDLRTWKASTLRQGRTVGTSTSVDTVSVSADGNIALVAMDRFIRLSPVDQSSANTRVQAFDLASGKPLGTAYLPDSSALTAALAVRPGGDGMAVATAGGRVILWNPPDRPDPAGWVSAIKADPVNPGSVLALYENGDLVRIDAADGRRTRVTRFTGHGQALALGLDPAGRVLAVGHGDGSVSLLAYPTLQRVDSATTSAARDGIVRLAFSPDGRTLASGDVRGAVRLWHLGRPDPPLLVTDGDRAPISDIAFDRNGVHALIGHRDGATMLVSAAGETLTETRYTTDASVILTTDKGFLVGFGEGRIGWVDDRLTVSNWLPVRHTINVLDGVISADGSLLGTTGADRDAKFTDLPTGQELARVNSTEPVPAGKDLFYAGAFQSIAFTRDGRHAVLGSTRGELTVITLATEPLIAYACSLLGRPDGDRCR